MKSNGQRGFSAVEMVTVVAILAIVAAIAIPFLIQYQRNYKFWNYSSQLEYLVKYAKIYAMEKTKNVGICVNGSLLEIRDLGTARNANACEGIKIKEMNISDNYVSMIASNGGNVVSIDPRGVAILPGEGGNICLSYNNKHFKVIIGKTHIRTENGNGGC